VTVELIPIHGVPEVRPGDDLTAVLEPRLRAAAARDGDALAVTQKIVSKAEGRLVPDRERPAWIERETVDVVARRGDLVIARTRHGFVCANAGVDASNVPAGLLSLLPEDPDASAERLSKELGAALGLELLPVVVTDTFGRPWREGVVDVAIGCAGLAPLVDLRGSPDDRGRALETTVVALADAVAAASGLVMTKAARVPAALVRGLDPAPAGASPGPARALVRSVDDDLFRRSPLETVAGAGASTELAPGAVPVEALERAVSAASSGRGAVLLVAATSPAAARRIRAAAGDAGARRGASAFVVACVPPADAGGTQRASATLGALGVALRAEGLSWSWDPGSPFDPDAVGAALDLDRRWRPAGLVGVGRPPGSADRPR
jgi:dehydro coenzyme F420 reductase / coenzyme F420-0:L-glutamate ligase / coenzyme F420-1:gamma-L-glutamate ligase